MQLKKFTKMAKLSVVIITKNEERILPETLKAVQTITDDVLVCDTGSTDATIAVAIANGAKVIKEQWMGFGLTKNKANLKAKYDWILQLDADEIPDEQLQQTLKTLPLLNEKELYSVQFKNYLAEKWLQYGEWGTDAHIRLFNKKNVKWNDAPVHEELLYDKSFTVTKLQGFILHKTMQSKKQYAQKMKLYSERGGEKYFEQGKKGAWWKQYLSPILNFVKNYFFKLGFLDVAAGLTVAKMQAAYTYKKYATLNSLLKKNKHLKKK